MPRETYRSVKLRVFTSDLLDYQDFVLEPPPGKLYLRDSMKLVASQFIYDLKAQFPGNEFKLVPKGGNRYNIVPIALANA